MKRLWSPALLLAALVLLHVPADNVANAETFPSKPVRIISDAAPGSAPDVLLRIIGDRLTRTWGQQVVIVNQPGAGGALAARSAANAAPDGQTLFMVGTAAFVAPPGVAPNIPVHVPRDFAPIGIVGEHPMFVTVAPATGIASLAELIEVAKRRPKELVFASTGRGRFSHLTGEMLQSRASIQLLMVPYAGGPAQALGDVMGGRVHVVIEGGAGLAAFVEAGTLRAIAVGAAARLAEFPDLPTVSETIPDFYAAAWLALVAPAGTPASIVTKVNEDMRAVLSNPEVRKRLVGIGSYPRLMTPEEATAFIQNEQRVWSPVVEHFARKQQGQ